MFQLATSAPGLSAMVFVKEFIEDEAAGKAALFDLPTKLYLIFGLPRLLVAFGDKDGSRRRQNSDSTLASLARDPLNVAIVGGIAMAATGTPFETLHFAGKAVSALASAQTPVLFVLIGMKVKLSGATPAASVALLALRHAASYAFFTVAASFVSSTTDSLTLLLMCQAAVSVIGWSQMSKAKDAGILGYDTAFAFDIVGFSMPLTMLLQTAVCLAPPSAAVASVRSAIF